MKPVRFLEEAQDELLDFAVRMQEVEVARTPETLGHHMVQHQPEELRAGHGPRNLSEQSR